MSAIRLHARRIDAGADLYFTFMDYEEKPARRRFTIAVFGNRGTVFPLLAVGRRLVERGHQVVFAAPDRFRARVMEAGLEHGMLRPDPLLAQETKAGTVPGKGDTESGLRTVVFPSVGETFDDLLTASADADALIVPMFLFPAPMAAERLRIPWVEVHFTPGTFNSLYDPPLIPPVAWLHPLQRRFPFISRAFNCVAARAMRSWYAPLRALREREGFAPDDRNFLLGGMRSPWLTLALFSHCMGAQQADWPAPALITGFPFYDEPVREQDAVLNTFLEAGEPPIVATLGSVISEHRQAFYRATVEAAKRLGRRLIIVLGPGERTDANVADDAVLRVEYAAYSLVFSRACAVVISGSIGPISHALRAGRPMLVVPAETALDQPDNALRVSRLRTGSWMMLGNYTADTATAHLQELLTNPAYAQKAKMYGDLVRAEDGIDIACNALEEVAQRRTFAGAA